MPSTRRSTRLKQQQQLPIDEIPTKDSEVNPKEKAKAKPKSKPTPKAIESYTGRKRTPSRRMVELLKNDTEDQSQQKSISKKKQQKRKKQGAAGLPACVANRNISPSSLSGTSPLSSVVAEINPDEIQCFLCSKDDFSDETQYPIGHSQHDPCNQILLCDSPTCKAVAYHQRCHFVPLFVIPRGMWVCLLCRYEEEKEKSTNKISGDSPASRVGKKKKQKTGSNELSQHLDEFDHKAKDLKAEYTHEILQHLSKSLDQSLSQIRAAENTIRAYTETERSRKELISHFPRIPSELTHAKLKFSRSKVRIRHQLLSLKHYVEDEPPRPEPRFDTDDQDSSDDDQSDEEEVPDVERTENRLDGFFSTGETAPYAKHQSEEDGSGTPYDDKDESSVDDQGKSDDGKTTESSEKMIHSSEIVCCVCHDGHSTDDNDIICCDGKRCFRAFHMSCLRPKLTWGILHKLRPGSDTWFCPFCTKLATFMHHVQEEYHGDDGYSTDWAEPEDVFPEAEDEYKTALLLQEGKASLSQMFGDAVEGSSSDESEKAENGDDDEDEEEDEDFDPDKKDHLYDNSDRGVDENSVSSLSGNESSDSVENDGTLKDELAALSSADEDDMDDDTSGRRRTRSTVKVPRAKPGQLAAPTDSDIGTLDRSNIVHGKRKRTKVDYRKLNDSMFGDVPEDIAKKMLDEDDDEYTAEGNESGDEFVDESNFVDAKRKRNRVDYKKLNDTMFSEASRDAGKARLDDGGNGDGEEPTGRGRHLRENSSLDDEEEKESLKRRNLEGEDIMPPIRKRQKTAQDPICACKKNKCLKKYCVCFANSQHCSDRCSCADCHNAESTRKDQGGLKHPAPNSIGELALACEETMDTVSRKQQISTAPPKRKPIRHVLLSPSTTERDEEGLEKEDVSKVVKTAPLVCMCKNSKCTKKYCVCYSSGRRCSGACQCVDCCNMEGVASVSTPVMSSEVGSSLEHGGMKDHPIEEAARGLQSLLNDGNDDDDGVDQLKTTRSPDRNMATTEKCVSQDNISNAKADVKDIGKTVPSACSCRKSRCLKMYCVCYANSRRCTDACQCADCANSQDLGLPTVMKPPPMILPKKMEPSGDIANSVDNVAYGPQDQTMEALSLVALKRMGSLVETTVPIDNSAVNEQKNKAASTSIPSGCSCKKSRCLKLYCVCYSNCRRCSDICQCIDCSNTPELGPITEVKQRPSAAKKQQQQQVVAISHPPMILPKTDQTTNGAIFAADNVSYGLQSPGHDKTVDAMSLVAIKRVGSEPGPSDVLDRVRRSPASEKRNKLSLSLPSACSCKKSRCLKLYCVCYANGRRCSDECQCVECSNKDGGGTSVVGKQPTMILPKHAPQSVVEIRNPAMESVGDSVVSAPPISQHQTQPRTQSASENLGSQMKKSGASSVEGLSKISPHSFTSNEATKERSMNPGDIAFQSIPANSSHLTAQLVCSHQPLVSLNKVEAVDKSKLNLLGGGAPKVPTSPRNEKKKSSSKADSDSVTNVCACKRSKCLKLYCCCYANSRRCTKQCQCQSCLNRACPDNCRCLQCTQRTDTKEADEISIERKELCLRQSTAKGKDLDGRREGKCVGEEKDNKAANNENEISMVQKKLRLDLSNVQGKDLAERIDRKGDVEEENENNVTKDDKISTEPKYFLLQQSLKGNHLEEKKEGKGVLGAEKADKASKNGNDISTNLEGFCLQPSTSKGKGLADKRERKADLEEKKDDNTAKNEEELSIEKEGLCPQPSTGRSKYLVEKRDLQGSVRKEKAKNEDEISMERKEFLLQSSTVTDNDIAERRKGMGDLVGEKDTEVKNENKISLEQHELSLQTSSVKGRGMAEGREKKGDSGQENEDNAPKREDKIAMERKELRLQPSTVKDLALPERREERGCLEEEKGYLAANFEDEISMDWNDFRLQSYTVKGKDTPQKRKGDLGEQIEEKGTKNKDDISVERKEPQPYPSSLRRKYQEEREKRGDLGEEKEDEAPKHEDEISMQRKDFCLRPLTVTDRDLGEKGMEVEDDDTAKNEDGISMKQEEICRRPYNAKGEYMADRSERMGALGLEQEDNAVMNDAQQRLLGEHNYEKEVVPTDGKPQGEKEGSAGCAGNSDALSVSRLNQGGKEQSRNKSLSATYPYVENGDEVNVTMA